MGMHARGDAYTCMKACLIEHFLMPSNYFTHLVK